MGYALNHIILLDGGGDVKRIAGSRDLEKTSYQIEEGETAYTLLKKTGLELDVVEHPEFGVYVKAIEGP